MAEAISQHKKMAMGEGAPLASGKSVMPKYAKGGAVKVPDALDSSRKNPLPRPAPGNAGKIATLKKGGAAKKGGRGC